MTFELQFDADNAAFAGNDWQPETVRILTEVARRIEMGDNSGTIRDINGNTVGKFAFKS